MLQQTIPNRPYRELLDWFAAQVDRLDAHARHIAANADRLSPEDLAAQQRAIAEAHAWLAEQLAQALAQREMSQAA